MINSTHTIELAFDAAGTDEDTKQYAEWLEEQGHTVTIGTTTVTIIDGTSTSICEEAREQGNQLWEEFCSSN